MAEVKRETNAKAWQALRQIADGLGNSELKVGWFSSNRYPDGTPVAAVASAHEFGVPSHGLPARPFMRPTVAREEGAWRGYISQEVKKVVAGRQTVKGVLDTLGLRVSAEIARSISDVTSPPLKEATIAAKRAKMANQKKTGSLDKPLIETRLMFDSVTYVVDDADDAE